MLFAMGANWAAWAHEIKEADGFNPRLGPGGTSGSRGQESDMQYILRSRGCRGFYVPGALVHHYVPVNRCSAEWALRRARLHGSGEGLREPIGSHPRVFGIPRWQWRVLALAWLKRAASIFRRNAETRFVAAHTYAYEAGRTAGMREQLSHGGIDRTATGQ